MPLACPRIIDRWGIELITRDDSDPGLPEFRQPAPGDVDFWGDPQRQVGAGVGDFCVGVGVAYLQDNRQRHERYLPRLP